MNTEESIPTQSVVSEAVPNSTEIVPPVPEKKKRGRKAIAKRDEYYLAPEDFLNEINKFYETDIITPELGIMVLKIATGLGHAHNFINYSYKEEMIGDAMMRMFQALRNKKYVHGPGRNPFSYFNTIAHHAFLNRIKKEKRNHEAIDKYQEEVYPDLLWENSSASGRTPIHNND